MSPSLILAYRGAWQTAERFAELTGLEQSSELVGCYVQFPDQLNPTWTTRDAPRVVQDARDARARHGLEPDCPVYLVGFSAGGYLVHVAAHLLGEQLAGLWVHSGTYPPEGLLPLRNQPRVVLSCNDRETNRLPRFRSPWYSMHDYREMAAERYEEPLILTGTGRHRWDSSLNSAALAWLVEGKR